MSRVFQRATKGLGIASIVFATIALILAVTHIGLATWRKSKFDSEFYDYSFFKTDLGLSVGLTICIVWLFFVCVFTIHFADKLDPLSSRKRLIIIMVLNILSAAIFCPAAIFIASASSVQLRSTAYIPQETVAFCVLLPILISSLCFIVFILSIVTASMCCCCNSEETGTTYQPLYSTEHNGFMFPTHIPTVNCTPVETGTGMPSISTATVITTTGH